MCLCDSKIKRSLYCVLYTSQIVPLEIKYEMKINVYLYNIYTHTNRVKCILYGQQNKGRANKVEVAYREKGRYETP